MTVPEEWRPIPGLPDYQASNLGRIRSKRSGTWWLLDGSLSGNGYRYVKVIQGDCKRSRSIHSLVAEAFHGPRPPGREVRHLDGVYTHNAASNLCWGTPSQNRHDSVRHGTHRSLAGRPRAA